MKTNVNFISYTLRRTVDLTVVIPSVTIPESLMKAQGEKISHVIEHKYPVLYLLHGYGNNHATWTGYSNVELYAEERQIAVVMLSAENKAYLDCGGDDDYFDFIENELQEFITNMFPVSTKPEDTYIAGLSMGGYGSLCHGLTNPHKYAAIGSFSGAVNGMNRDLKPLDILKKDIEEGKKLPPMYIAIGEEDFLFEATLQFKAELDKLGVNYTYEQLPNFTHEWRFWDMQVEKYLDWIPRTDHYAGKKRKV